MADYLPKSKRKIEKKKKLYQTKSIAINQPKTLITIFWAGLIHTLLFYEKQDIES